MPIRILAFHCLRFGGGFSPGVPSRRLHRHSYVNANPLFIRHRVLSQAAEHAVQKWEMGTRIRGDQRAGRGQLPSRLAPQMFVLRKVAFATSGIFSAMAMFRQ
jgi:hypothetical protein